MSVLVPARLKEAVSVRQARVNDLAGQIGVSTGLVQGWLDGTARPDAAQLLRLSVLLAVPPAFLVRERRGDGPHCFHRAAPQMGERCLSEMESLLLWLGDVHEALGRWIEFPEPAVPVASEPEEGATAVRDALGLGLGPVSNVMAALERLGVVVGTGTAGRGDLVGSTRLDAAGPLAVLKTDGVSPVRLRFNAAHELGHIVLHRHVTAGEFDAAVSACRYDRDYQFRPSPAWSKLEGEADAFARAFLLPAASFGAEAETSTPGDLPALQRRWKVPLLAMIDRMRDLGLLDRNGRAYWVKRVNTKAWLPASQGTCGAWLPREPIGDELQQERPGLLASAVELAVTEGGVGRREIVEATGLSSGDVEALCGLPGGWIAGGNVVPLRGERSTLSVRSCHRRA
ncbi:ImmA/IrrE family metallo-endopeptidase [Azospirillum sp. TSO5]|uniref:ImmA/IrrE family metallo-endopeptidase n=1 Tax=Azospirillum sp. TSO5 TaxID=716760 RepID=UPI000D608F7E|nr:ImmA/IrrE family metallo-endopeptidase [Azospirillum sp. TSO5]PWC92939.1 hypothetical protein TSO5_16050 [Azospirillum sp. TSO5]